MTARQDIDAIVADGAGDKQGRIARLRAQRLGAAIAANLPFTWTPVAQVSVIIKGVSLNGSAVGFVIDLTIKGVTKSLHEWIVGTRSTPDWLVVNPPLFIDDPTGSVDLGGGRIGRDDFVAAMRKVFVDTFGAKIADIVRDAP